MRCHVHEFNASEGGAIRISLTYDAPDRAGKTHGRTDTYRVGTTGRIPAIVATPRRFGGWDAPEATDAGGWCAG